MGATVNTSAAMKTFAAAKEVIKSLVATAPTVAELEQARSEAMTNATKALALPEGIAEAWLDIDTYQLPPISEQISLLQKASAADVQRVAGRLLSNAPVASVAIGNSQQLKTALAQGVDIELLGEVQNATPGPTPSKPD
jgi:predicted Zn-dependent peptidase